MAPELAVNLDAVRDFDTALQDLEAKWKAMSPPVRRALSRLVWLHPDGETVVYQPPPTNSTRDEL